MNNISKYQKKEAGKLWYFILYSKSERKNIDEWKEQVTAPLFAGFLKILVSTHRLRYPVAFNSNKRPKQRLLILQCN